MAGRLKVWNGSGWDYVNPVVPTDDIIDLVYPVGSIYTELTGTNPATTFGHGTWVQFGSGDVLVGQDSGDSDFNTAEETGGAKTVAGASHSHTMSHTHSTPNHTHAVPHSGEGGGIFWNSGRPFGTTGSFSPNKYANSGTPGGSSAYDLTNNAGAGTTGGSSAGSTGSTTPSATSVVQPYIVVYFWKRTA